MKKIAGLSYALLIISILSLPKKSFSQNVGIGTNTPNAKAALEIKSTDKGVLFPLLTSTQRNAIANPPNGLHIFNTDERCLNYYDSTYQVWNCYCFDCQTVIINITANACKVDFYNTYARGAPSKKYLINIASGVSITGCNPGDTALSFSNMPFNAAITINNNGTIAGAGGTGGSGAIETGCVISLVFAQPGMQGGYAISTKPGVIISVNNYGIVAGAGGGGGGGSKNPNGQGGGGGGGAGLVGGNGGPGGGVYQSSQFGGCVPVRTAQPGAQGQPTIGGIGGAGANTGGTGGNGGLRGQSGQAGTGTAVAPGGLAGKATGGGSGNSLTNIAGGQSFGIVD